MKNAVFFLTFLAFVLAFNNISAQDEVDSETDTDTETTSVTTSSPTTKSQTATMTLKQGTETKAGAVNRTEFKPPTKDQVKDASPAKGASPASAVWSPLGVLATLVMLAAGLL